MKKFLLLKLFLILFVLIIGIIVFFIYGFNVKYSYTYRYIKDYLNEYTLLYSIQMENDSKIDYIVYCKDDYYCSYKFYKNDSIDVEDNLKIEQKDRKETNWIKGHSKLDGIIKYINQVNTNNLLIDYNSKDVKYKNDLKDYLDRIINMSIYKKGYEISGGNKYYYEEFDYKALNNNGEKKDSLRFVFNQEELKEIVVNQDDNLKMFDIRLFLGYNGDSINAAEKRFNDTKINE